MNSERLYAAKWLLYAASILGILELFSSGDIEGHFTPFMWVDIVVYVLLFGLAVLIGKGVKVVQWIYFIAAVVWYVALIMILADKYGHSLNGGMVFTQIILSLSAYYVLLTKWWGDRKG